MKPQLIGVSLAITGLLVWTATAQQNEANRLRQSADSTFMMKAAQGGMAEVELGKMAVQKASSDRVKQFGQQMVDDHSRANDELKSLAAGKGMTLPGAVDAKDKATIRRLEGLQGEAFDRAYMEDMVNDHQADIAEFQREADHGSDPEVKAWAAKTLPTLQHHLQMAQDVWSAVKGGRL
jgi:putative membrane protein